VGLLRTLLPCVAAAALAACGSGAASLEPLPGPGTARLDPIYDVSITFPSTQLIIAGLTYVGLDIDLEIAFDDASVRDPDPLFTGRGRVLAVRAGGVPQAYEAAESLDVGGTYDGAALATDLLGPIRIGGTTLLVGLSGGPLDGARRVAGNAGLFGLPDAGSFVAVKRRRYLVAGTDLQSPIGKVAIVTVRDDTRMSVDQDLTIVSGDPVARVEDDRPFIVNRFTYDNIQGLDPSGSFATVFEDSVGNLANPHDLVVPPPGAAGDEGLAFVTRYGAGFNDLAVLDLGTGQVVDRIDLAPYARNSDHLARPDQALLHDGLIYVTLEDANASFTTFMNGRVAVVDPVLRQVIDLIDLDGQNPFESLSFAPSTGLIYVGLAGLFPGLASPTPVLSGGVETIDPVTRSTALLVDDDALGGNVSAVAIESATRGYCVVSDAAFHNYVKTFDPTTGEVLGTIFDSTDQIATIEVDGDGYLLVADSSLLAPRILIFDAGTGAPVASLPVHLPPFSFAILTRSLP